eukprot:262697_1
MPRMPHNNRMSTSGTLNTNDIWSKAIGHDPYAAGAGGDANASTNLDAEKTKTLLEIARTKNVSEGLGGAGASGGNASSDFVAKMYNGLKSGKKRRADHDNNGLVAGGANLGMSDDSSSEEEFVEEPVVKMTLKLPEKKEKRNKDKDKERRRSKKKKYSSDSDSSSSTSSSDDSSEESRRRRKRRKRNKDRDRDRDRDRKHKRRHKHKSSRSRSKSHRKEKSSSSSSRKKDK